MSQIIKPRSPIINWSNPITNRLVYHLPYREGAGSALRELIKANNGTWNGTLGSQWSNQLYGLSGSFNGTDNFISGTDSKLPLGASARTIAVWVYPKSVSIANQAFFNYGTAATSNGWLFCTVGASAGIQVGIFGSNFGGSSGNLTVNTWNYAVVSFDGNQTCSYYINGASVGTATAAGTNTTSGGVSRIGHSIVGWNTGDFVNGYIVNTSVWSRALSAQEVKQLYINPFSIYYMKRSLYLIN